MNMTIKKWKKDIKICRTKWKLKSSVAKLCGSGKVLKGKFLATIDFIKNSEIDNKWLKNVL